MTYEITECSDAEEIAQELIPQHHAHFSRLRDSLPKELPEHARRLTYRGQSTRQYQRWQYALDWYQQFGRLANFDFVVAMARGEYARREERYRAASTPRPTLPPVETWPRSDRPLVAAYTDGGYHHWEWE